MHPTSPSWRHWLQDLGSHTAAYDRESKRLKKSSSDWLNSGNALNLASEKNAIFVFPVLLGSAEAQVIWDGIIKRLLITYFIGSTSAKKNIKIRSRVSKLQQAKGGTFLRHGVQSYVQLNLMTILNTLLIPLALCYRAFIRPLAALDAADCYRRSSVVCLSVSLSRSWALQKRLSRSRYRLRCGLGVNQRSHVLDGGARWRILAYTNDHLYCIKFDVYTFGCSV